MTDIETTGKDLLDLVHTRIAAAITPVLVYYQGVQADTAEYVLILSDDEREIREWSDKDQLGIETTITLQLWGQKPRTLSDRARTIIESLFSATIDAAGFSGQIVTLLSNSGQPALTLDGEKDQYSRVIRIAFVSYPD